MSERELCNCGRFRLGDKLMPHDARYCAGGSRTSVDEATAWFDALDAAGLLPMRALREPIVYARPDRASSADRSSKVTE